MRTKENEKKYIDNLNSKEKKWVQTKPFGTYNYRESFIRIRDFSYIVELLQLDENKKMALLDLGCGSGWTSIMLAKFGIDVIGMDISKDMIEIAKANAKKEKIKIKFLVGDIETQKYRNKFDRVLIYDALHHCPNEKKVLKNIYRALKPGGMVLVVEPNKVHDNDMGAKKVAERFGVLEKGYSPRYLKSIMSDIGFKNFERFHCDYGINRPLSDKLKTFTIQILRMFANRFVINNYISQVWLRGEK